MGWRGKKGEEDSRLKHRMRRPPNLETQRKRHTRGGPLKPDLEVDR